MFIARGKEDALVTKNLVPGDTVYGEKKIEVEVSIHQTDVFCILLIIVGLFFRMMEAKLNTVHGTHSDQN